MANKRDLKKEIKYVCGDLAAECILAKNFIKGVDSKAMTAAIGEIASLQTAALSNVSFSFDKYPSDFPTGHAYHKARREYYAEAYKVLRDKFYDKVQEIVKQMNAALPQAVKDANKK